MLNTELCDKGTVHNVRYILTSSEIGQTLLCLHNSKGIFFFLKPVGICFIFSEVCAKTFGLAITKL